MYGFLLIIFVHITLLVLDLLRLAPINILTVISLWNQLVAHTHCHNRHISPANQTYKFVDSFKQLANLTNTVKGVGIPIISALYQHPSPSNRAQQAFAHN